MLEQCFFSWPGEPVSIHGDDLATDGTSGYRGWSGSHITLVHGERSKVELGVYYAFGEVWWYFYGKVIHELLTRFLVIW